MPSRLRIYCALCDVEVGKIKGRTKKATPFHETFRAVFELIGTPLGESKVCCSGCNFHFRAVRHYHKFGFLYLIKVEQKPAKHPRRNKVTSVCQAGGEKIPRNIRCAILEDARSLKYALPNQVEGMEYGPNQQNGTIIDGRKGWRYKQLVKRMKLTYAKQSKVEGMGLFTGEDMQEDDVAIEYKGKRISSKERDRREKFYRSGGMLKDNFFKVADDVVLDANNFGNDARYANHSCDSNLNAQFDNLDGVPYVIYYANREIRKDTELTVDYGMSREVDQTLRVRCLCGSRNCRGYLN